MSEASQRTRGVDLERCTLGGDGKYEMLVPGEPPGQKASRLVSSALWASSCCGLTGVGNPSESGGTHLLLSCILTHVQCVYLSAMGCHVIGLLYHSASRAKNIQVDYLRTDYQLTLTSEHPSGFPRRS
jgi:hypothetical protein